LNIEPRTWNRSLQMGIHALPQDPANNKKSALNGEEARRLLEKFDIALVPERFVRRPTEVVAAARRIGFPVVLKGMGANLLHKTDRGLVYLNLLDAAAVKNAVQEIAAEAREQLEGFLIRTSRGGENLWRVCFRMINLVR
jgi:acyl-CoA synthetase (NDP forming)